METFHQIVQVTKRDLLDWGVETKFLSTYVTERLDFCLELKSEGKDYNEFLNYIN